VRDVLAVITRDVSESAGRQYVLRIKSLLAYAHRLGYAPFNAGTAIRVRSDARNRGAAIAKRIISEVDVALLVRGARTKRDRIMLEVLYAGGLRVSELVALTWSGVIARDKGQVQLNVVGKGGIERNVLLPEAVSRSLLSLHGDAGPNDPVFASRKGGGRLTERAVLDTVKRAARAARIEAPVSPHWLRHAHASHAIDRGATLSEVQSTLGHGNIATTSGYLHRVPRHPPGCISTRECGFDEDDE
jgi:integrase/recombinase XerD